MTRNAKTTTRQFLSLDTTFVLFFLSLELGRSAEFFSTDTLLLVITSLMVLVLPYFLVEVDGIPAFGRWLGQRSLIGLIGVAFGVGIRHGIGSVLPESVAYIPMTLLIITAVISSYVQIYGLMRLRLAK